MAGSSHQELGHRVAEYLGRSLDKVKLLKFADGERLAFYEDSAAVKGKHVHIIQSTSNPVNEHMMELFFMVSAAKRAGAASITCIIPYYGYARQERKFANNAVPVSAADIA